MLLVWVEGDAWHGFRGESTYLMKSLNVRVNSPGVFVSVSHLAPMINQVDVPNRPVKPRSRRFRQCWFWSLDDGPRVVAGVAV